MNAPSRPLQLPIGMLSLLVSCSTLHAADLFWDGTPGTPNGASDGGVGTWDTSTANWDDGIYNIWNNGGNDTAIFGGTAGAVDLGADVTVGGLTFNTNGYSLTDGDGLNAVTFGTAGNIDVNNGDDVEISASLSGTGGITKIGNGVLDLRGDSDFTGGFNIAAGTVEVNGNSSANAFGASGNTVTFTGNSTLRNYSGGTFTMVQDLHYNTGITGTLSATFGESLNLDGVLSGDGTLLMSGGSANGNVRLRNAANTFTGTLDIRMGGGNAQLLQITSLADSSNPIQIGNNTQDVQVTFVNSSDLVFNGRQVQLRSSSTSGEARISANGTGTVSFNAGITGTTAGTKPLLLGGNNSGNNTVGGAITDGAGVIAVTKQNSGRWILAGENTYTGDTTVNGGTLVISSTAELLFEIGATGVNNQISGSAAIDLDGAFVFDLTGASTTISDSWNIVDVDNLTETYSGTFSVESTLGVFTDVDGDLWTLAENGVLYEFTESTGTLNVAAIPEPGVALLSGLGAFLLLRRRRG